MSETAAPTFEMHTLLEAAEARIRATGGIPHDEFWRQVDAEYDNSQDDSGENAL